MVHLALGLSDQQPIEGIFMVGGQIETTLTQAPAYLIERTASGSAIAPIIQSYKDAGIQQLVLYAKSERGNLSAKQLLEMRHAIEHATTDR